MKYVAGADPEIGHGGGLNFGRFFSHKTTKLCTNKAPKKKKRNKLYTTSPKLTIFWKSCQKNGEKIAHFLRAPCKILQFCKFAPEVQENFAIISLKYGQRAIQNGGCGPDGGVAPPAPSLDPPLTSTLLTNIVTAVTGVS